MTARFIFGISLNYIKTKELPSVASSPILIAPPEYAPLLSGLARLVAFPFGQLP